MKKIGFSTVALLAILLTSFRPAFAAENIDLAAALRREIHKSTHQQSKFRTPVTLSSAAYTEADSEEADESEDEASFQHIDFFLSLSSFNSHALPFCAQVENPRLSTFFSLIPQGNTVSLFLKHRQILR